MRFLRSRTLDGTTKNVRETDRDPGYIHAMINDATHEVFADEGLELLYLLPKLPDELNVGILVDRRLVDNILGAVRIPERAQGLAVVAVGWTDGRDHDGFGIAAEGVLEQPGKYAVAVGDEDAAPRAVRVRR